MENNIEPKQVIVDYDKYKELNKVYNKYCSLYSDLKDFVNKYNKNTNSMMSIYEIDCTTTVIGANEINKIKENYLEKFKEMEDYEKERYNSLYESYNNLKNKVKEYNELTWYKKIYKKIKL